MSDYKNPGGYKYNGRKMNSEYANLLRAEIAQSDRIETPQRPQRHYNNERDGIAINPISAGLVVALVGFSLYWVKGWMAGWSSYDLPWKFIAGYYNIIFGWPLDTFPRIWVWLQDIRLMHHAKKDMAIAVVGIIMYGLIVLSIYIKISRTIINFGNSKMNDGGGILLSNVLGLPLFLGGLISLIRAVFRWIF
ncbi:hypothetical protein [Psychrobacter aquimaris]|uniref:hypothetical protein n=1 Tax=Psychrobacter aquimaris TaxID=292733 RepID=UPI003FCF016D